MKDPKEAAERAHSMALNLLAHRSRSIEEMRSRLISRGFDELVVEAEIHRLKEVGLLDDENFAREKARSLVKRGIGPRGLSARLCGSGLGEEVARTSLERVMEESGGELVLAREAIRKRFGDLSGAQFRTKAKAAQYLVRRGFSRFVAATACGIFSDESIE